MYSKIHSYLVENKKQILRCLIFTFAWGIAAHGYMFFSSAFSHDSLNEFNAEIFGNDWKIQLGRIFVPLYRMLTRGNLTLPWLIGMLALIWLSAAVFLTLKLFETDSVVLTFLTAGIFTANLTVTATTGTYISDLDANMFACMLAVAAVYLWNRYEKGFWIGIAFVGCATGLYQSYISVAITLIMLVLVMRLLKGSAFSEIFVKGIKGAAMLFGGGVFYLVFLKIVPLLTNLSLISGNYNSVDKAFSLTIPQTIRMAVRAYMDAICIILKSNSVFPATLSIALHAALILIAGVCILRRLADRDMGRKEKVLCLFLIVLLPLGMNISQVLSGGMSHDLMYFAFWFVYVFALLIAWWYPEYAKRKVYVPSAVQCVLSAIVAVVLFINIRTANAVYLRKDIQQNSNLSLFTRVLGRIEATEGYESGETPVVFVGNPDTALKSVPGFENYQTITGVGNNSILETSQRERYVAYFNYALQNSAVIAQPEIWDEMQKSPEVQTMPVYPEVDSIKMIDGIIVVKFDS